MKKGFFILIVLFAPLAFAQAPEPNTIAKLQDSIKQLDMEISHLLKIIELQRKEIEFLRKLCTQAGIDVLPKQAKISEPLFGIYLGESLGELRTRLRVSRSDRDFAYKNRLGQVWSVENNDPNITGLSVNTLNEQIYEIDVEFADANSSNCETIKSQLQEKYKAAGTDTFETVIDGVNIEITLNCPAGNNNGISLTYTHIPLMREMSAELEKRKADQLRNEQITEE